MLIGTQLNAVDERLLSVVVSTNSQGDNTLLAAVTGQVIKIYRLVLSAAGAVTITIKDGSTALTGAMSLATGVPLILGFETQPWFVCTGSLNLSLGGGVQVSGVIYYSRSD